MQKEHFLSGLLIVGSIGVGVGYAKPATSKMSNASSSYFLQSRNNSINGLVFGPDGRAVPNIYVELLDENEYAIQRTKTDNSGRFIFRGLTSGRFMVFVRPFGLNYQETKKEAYIENVSRGTSTSSPLGFGGQSLQLEVYLRALRNESLPPAASVFVQDVPPTAKQLYEKGIAQLDKNEEEPGLASLRQSLEAFPDYYAALDRLGTEYVKRGYYEPAIILLTKAVAVNTRSFNSFYGLGQAYFKLKQMPQSVENLQKAVNLYADSVNANIWLGMACRQSGKLKEAEAALTKAKKLNKEVPDVYWHLALVYNDMKRYADSAKELEALLKLNSPATDVKQIKSLIETLNKKAAAG